MKTEEEMIVEIKRLFEKGQTNPSACTAILYYHGFEGRFMEIRKVAEHQYKLYTMEQSKKKIIREAKQCDIAIHCLDGKRGSNPPLRAKDYCSLNLKYC